MLKVKPHSTSYNMSSCRLLLVIGILATILSVSLAYIPRARIKQLGLAANIQRTEDEIAQYRISSREKREDDTSQDSDDNSQATGDASQDSGDNSQATGDASQDSGDNSQATGDASQDSGDSSQATGDASQDSSDNSQATGDASQDSSDNSQGTGDDSQDSGDNSQSTGDDSQDSGDNSQSTGSVSQDSSDNSQATEDASQDNGDDSQATGDSSQDSGGNSQTTGDASQDSRDNSQATGDASHDSEDNSQATGDDSQDSGDNSQSTGDASQDSSENSQATGDSSHDNGDNSQATGDSSQDSGDNSQTTGDASQDSRDNSQATGDASHDSEDNSQATGDSSQDSESATEGMCPQEYVQDENFTLPSSNVGATYSGSCHQGLDVGVWVCVLDEEAGIAYWYLMSCEPLNEEETSHESSTPTEGTVDNDESKSSSQSSEISEDEQDKCNRTIIASDFMLPDAAVGTQVSGTCFDVYKGVWECVLSVEFAKWEMVECNVTEVINLSSEAITSDPMTSVKAVVDLTKYGSMSPKVAVQIVQSIVDRLVAESIVGPPLVLDPWAMLRYLAYLLQQTRELPVAERAPAASAILVQLDELALHVFENPGFVDVGFLKMNVVNTNFEGDVIGITVARSSIILPGEQLQEHTGLLSGKVASFYFSNMSGILEDNATVSGSDVVTPVISSAIQCGKSICNTHSADFERPVKIVLPNDVAHSLSREQQCQFWKIVPRNEISSPYTGSWYPDGCKLNSNESSDAQIVCDCNHLTHFGVLLSPGVELSEDHVFSLTVIGYVGVSISLVALAATVLIHICFRSLCSIRSYVHINLCVSLMAAQLLFVTAVDKTDNKVACSVIAVVLQYLFLTSFMWMLMEGVVLYFVLVQVFIGGHKKYIVAFTVISYGLPALYLVLTVPLGYLVNGTWHYGSASVCWLRYDTGFIWVFITPVMVILMINVGFFVTTMVVMCNHEKRRKDNATTIKSIKRWLKCIISLVVVMGFTWILGVVTFHKSLVPVVYIFTIFVALQGLVIFILFVVLSEQVKLIVTILKKCCERVVFSGSFYNIFVLLDILHPMVYRSHLTIVITKTVRDAFLKCLQQKIRKSSVLSDRFGTHIDKLMSSETKSRKSVNEQYYRSLHKKHSTAQGSTLGSTSTLVKSDQLQGLAFPNPTCEESKQDGTNLYESLDSVYANQNTDKGSDDGDYEDIEANYSPSVNRINVCDSSAFGQIDQYETQGFEIQLSNLSL